MTETHSIHHGEVDIHYVESGEGPVVILLHGFPELWLSWRGQIAVLAEAGYRVIAPDLRGYNMSGKPKGIGAYTIDRVASDVLGLIDALGGRARLVGHDWGGVVAWAVARRAPGKLECLVVMNIPHPRAMRRAARLPRQLRRFLYQFFFQLPWLPELLLRRRSFERLRTLLQRMSKRPDAFPPEVLQRYVESWSQPGALTAMLHYYRALYQRRRRSGGRPASNAPVRTMLIWGEKEPVFLRETVAWSKEALPGLRVELIRGAGHFVQSDAPDEVNRLLLAFFADGDEERKSKDGDHGEHALGGF